MGKLYPVEQVEDATGFYPKPPHGWTCFHCGELFTTQGAARNHFGFDPSSDPACRIKVGAERGLVMALRKAEAELYEYTNLLHDESLEAYRLLARARSQHGDQIQTAEELGYERGLADGRIEATPAVDREAAREAMARKLCEQHGADPDAVAREEHDCWDGPLWTVFLKDADAIMALPPVKQSDGLAERVKEACAKACEDQARDFLSPQYATPQPISSIQERFACRECASAIRSLDITRMDSDG